MPKFGIHYIVLRKVQERLDVSADDGDRDLARILEQNRFAANLGCIGPDLLFWAPDYGIVDGLQEIVAVYDAIMAKWEVLEEIADAIEEKIEEGVDAVLDAIEGIPVIGPVIATIEDYATAFAALKEGFEALAEGFENEARQALLVRLTGLDSAPGSEGNTLARSLFHGIFQSSQQGGREEMDWYWFEMLHYRKTGDFLKALIRNAEASGDEELMAYAYGYATHYATDLVGHPYVNTISGSPYRMNVQRHVVIENFMDQWKWGDHFDGDNIRNTLFDELEFEDVSELPDGIAALIADTMEEVYADVVHPVRYVERTRSFAESLGVRLDRDGFLTAKDIKTAYSFQKKMLAFLGGQETPIRPAEPFPGADAYLADLMSGGGLNIPPPPAMPPTALPSDIDEFVAALDAWLQAVADFLAWAADAAAQVAGAAVDAVETYLSDPAGETLKFIQAMAYLLQLMLYDIYRMIHQVLAISGLVYPEPDDVALTSPIAASLVTTRHVSYKGFPILKTPGQPHLDTRSHVAFMNDRDNDDFIYHDVERPETIASHYVAEGADTPDGFIDQVAFDADLMELYALAADPAETRTIQQENPKSFGNAVDVSIHILSNRGSDEKEKVIFCNWNLDGDRGYGYKSWDAIPFTVVSGEMDGAIVENEDLDEVNQQNYSVWTRVEEIDNGGDLASRYVPDIYIDDKELRHTLLAPLNISEHYIPAMFTDPALMSGTRRRRWTNLVPTRLAINTGTIVRNFFFCNGLTSTPSSGIRCTMALQKTLNRSFDGIAKESFRLRHIHNYTSPDWGTLSMLGDLFQAVPVDYLSALLNTDAIANGSPPVAIINPTQVAVVALLFHGMEKDIPLLISGHSQGGMITANAILVFSTFGQEHRDYLKEKVKLFHMEGELTTGTRDLLRDLVREYLVYIMNISDPQGTDLLLEATSGPFPLIPAQPGGLIREGDGIAAARAMLDDPDPLNVEYYLGLQAIGTGIGNDLTELIDYAQHVNMRAHFMPVQLPIIADDILNDHFRTDQGTLSDPTVQLSTPNALNGSSVKVRDFFTVN